MWKFCSRSLSKCPLYCLHPCLQGTPSRLQPSGWLVPSESERRASARAVQGPGAPAALAAGLAAAGGPVLQSPLQSVLQRAAANFTSWRVGFSDLLCRNEGQFKKINPPQLWRRKSLLLPPFSGFRVGELRVGSGALSFLPVHLSVHRLYPFTHLSRPHNFVGTQT